jgi:outer membrane protein assembly factor BamD
MDFNIRLFFKYLLKHLPLWSATGILLMIATLCACSEFSQETDRYAHVSADKMYDEAVAHVVRGDYSNAIKSYEALESHYPFGPYTQKGQLELIYTYYKNQDYVLAITAAERYARLHPRSSDVPYAYYIKGLAHMDQSHTYMDTLLSLDTSSRDISMLEAAFSDFQFLIREYPKNNYSADARQRMIYLRNMIAQHELTIARYYQKRRAYVAAANRARYIVEHIQETPSSSEALAILQACQKALETHT